MASSGSTASRTPAAPSSGRCPASGATTGTTSRRTTEGGPFLVVDRVEDTDRAVERSLSGVGSDDWGDVAAHNRRIADRVADVHGDPHGATAHAYADFMSNHYAKRLEAASPAERREFREEYLPRNGWPTEAQREAVEESLRRIEETAETE